MAYAHQSVLPKEALAFWRARPGGLYLDATVGLGGHAEALLASDPSARVLGLDVDPEALVFARSRLSGFGPRAFLIKEAYMNLENALAQSSFKPPIDGILADLGVSSLQIDDPKRGFSFQKEGPLDMRMDPESGETALDLIRESSPEELARIFKAYGEENLAWPIAQRLKEAEKKGGLKNTLDLARIISSAYGSRAFKQKIHPATRVFQALRIAVNREMDNLDAFLKKAPGLLAKGGRLVMISFHSLEDRKVKSAFRDLARGCVCPADFPKCVCGKSSEFRVLTKKPVVPKDEEISANPRSRSARLRVLEKI